jgi:hypothetical protein
MIESSKDGKGVVTASLVTTESGRRNRGKPQKTSVRITGLYAKI